MNTNNLPLVLLVVGLMAALIFLDLKKATDTSHATDTEDARGSGWPDGHVNGGFGGGGGDAF